MAAADAAFVAQERSAMRLPALDGIRGVAAFLVVLNHCFLILPEAVSKQWIVPLIKWTPLRVIMVGRPAVIMFFVLSGLVLGRSLLSTLGKDSYGAFALRRFVRIYPTYAAAVLFAAMLWTIENPVPIADLTPWFNSHWTEPPNLNVIANHLLMLNRKQDVTLDMVIWSLSYEMRISLLIPLLVVAALRFGTLRFAGAVLALALIVEIALWQAGIESGAYHNETLLGAFLTTAHYVPFFAAGLLIAIHLERFRQVFSGLTWRIALPLWLFVGASMTQYPDVISGTGAVIAIGLVLGSERSAAMLCGPVIGWLGRVSYSLYLFHLPILLLLTHELHGNVPAPLYLGFGVAVSLVVAEVAYRLIERPSIDLGRRLTARSRMQASALA